MKRIGNIYSKIISPENLALADRRARRGKANQYGVRVFLRDPVNNLQALHVMLRDKTYRTSPYVVFRIFEPKERIISRLPFFPDRITHHAVMSILEPIFVSLFTADTYSCIKGRGIHGALRGVKRALKDQDGTRYCLKLDITKFYPNIDHDILKVLLRRKFKDPDLLWLLDEIIDSSPGVPIGNYLSQFLANYYLTGLDRFIKEKKKVRHYFRYADDLVLFSPDKASLHRLLADIREYLWTKLRLRIKPNYQIFPVDARGLDFIGYVFRHTHTRLRPLTKKNFARAMVRRPSPATIASYWGWAAHCNSAHLLKTLGVNTSFYGKRSQNHRRPAPAGTHHLRLGSRTDPASRSCRQPGHESKRQDLLYPKARYAPQEKIGLHDRSAQGALASR